MAERSSPNLAVVTLLAGLAGAGLALLFAPRSGRETREKIQEKAEDIKDRAENSLHDIKDKVSSGIEKGRESLASTVKSSSKKSRDEFEELNDLEERPTNRQSSVLNAWEEEV